MSVALKRSPDVEWGKGYRAGGGPSTWRRIAPHPERPAAFARDVALVTCTKGHESILSAKVHTVDASGSVSPSYVCPYGCTFHEHISLEGWSS